MISIVLKKYKVFRVYNSSSCHLLLDLPGQVDDSVNAVALVYGVEGANITGVIHTHTSPIHIKTTVGAAS